MSISAFNRLQIGHNLSDEHSIDNCRPSNDTLSGKAFREFEKDLRRVNMTGHFAALTARYGYGRGQSTSLPRRVKKKVPRDPNIRPLLRETGRVIEVNRMRKHWENTLLNGDSPVPSEEVSSEAALAREKISKERKSRDPVKKTVQSHKPSKSLGDLSKLSALSSLSSVDRQTPSERLSSRSISRRKRTKVKSKNNRRKQPNHRVVAPSSPSSTDTKITSSTTTSSETTEIESVGNIRSLFENGKAFKKDIRVWNRFGVEEYRQV